jgi:RimJ/RimL family protein N-acetyltransferase
MIERIHSREQVYALFAELEQEDNWYWWVEGAYPSFLKFEDWIRVGESDSIGVFLHRYKTSCGNYNLLGFSKFYITNLLHGFSYLTVWTRPSLRKQRGLVPYGFIVAAEAINFALRNFPLRKIYFHIVEDNLVSLGPVQKVARLEGAMQEHYFLEGRYHNLIILSIGRETWQQFYKRYEVKIDRYF